MLTRDREFYRMFLRLCIALMVEQAVILSVNLADNLMLGTYSQAALSGVAAVNQIQFVFQQLVYAIGNAVIAISSQYWGKRCLGEIRQVSALGMRAEILLALLLFTLVSLFPQGTLRLFTPKAEYIDQGVAYLKIIRFSYLFFAMTAVLLSTMRAVESVKIALRVSIVSLIVNVSTNFLLIHGRMGMPEMGVRGAAIGTLSARVIEFFIVFYFVLKDKKLELRIRDMLSFNGELLPGFIRVLIPTVSGGLVWGVANALQTVILGHMSDSAIAAQSISNTLFLLLKVSAAGAASAAAVIIGKTVGEGKLEKVRDYSRTLQIIFLGIGTVLCVMMMIIRIPLLKVYESKISAETFDFANMYMMIQAVVLLLTSYQMPVNNGIIRGGGDVKHVLRLDLIAVFTGIPFAWLGGLYWGWSAAAVILILNADQLWKCFPAVIYCNRYKWIRDLTRK